MAGAGFKTFTTGEVLLAADVNTYLMQQTVMVFDDASARATAIPTPSEGMFSYLKDTNLTYRYDGSAWISDAGATSPLTTKGDVWGYSTTDARIPVGADGTVLTADSAEALGVKWASSSAPSNPAFCAYDASSQSISSATWTKLTFGSERFDTNNCFASSTFTPTTAGKYYINFVIGYNPSTASTNNMISIYKNGSNYAIVELNSAGFENEGVNSGGMFIDFNGSTDYVEIYYFRNSGTGTVSKTEFSGFWVRS